MGGSLNPVDWFKAIAAAIKWPVKAMVVVCLSCVVLLLFGSKLPIGDQIQPYRAWFWIAGLFSGVWIAVSALDEMRKALVSLMRKGWRQWRLEKAIRNLEFDESTILCDYLENDTIRQHILTSSSGLVSLIRKGILVKSPEETGYWVDRISYDLTAESNHVLRKQKVRLRVFSIRDAGITRLRQQT